MLSVVVRRWAAWTPGLERLDDWERWCRVPTALGAEGAPELPFLPPLFRRRCSRLSRLMLHAAYAACEPDDVSALPAVFASRFGELGLTVSLLESLARKEPLTASGFTHSVHNTQIGLFSIAAKNRRMASALAAGAETFPYAVIEALASIERAGGGPALVVIGDEPLPAALEAFEGDGTAYALALVIARAGDGPRVRFAPAAAAEIPAEPRWPQALEFLRWLLSDEPSITLGDSGRGFTWTRA